MGRREAEQIDAALRWFEHELNPVHSGRSSSCTQPSTDNNNKNSLGWADAYMLGELSFSAARVLLFLRAIIKHPDIVVLDEAFGGMDEAVRDKCMLFLARGEEKTLAPGGRSHQSVGAFAVESAVARSGQVKIAGLADHQALVCISHVKEEVPDCVREWLCLPEINSGEPARCGRLDGPLRRDGRRWAEIWGVGRGA